jgi:NADPH:quinone reductase
MIDHVVELTEGRYCEVVIEATGQQAALDFASQITGVRGRLVIVAKHEPARQCILAVSSSTLFC